MELLLIPVAALALMFLVMIAIVLLSGTIEARRKGRDQERPPNVQTK